MKKYGLVSSLSSLNKDFFKKNPIIDTMKLELLLILGVISIALSRNVCCENCGVSTLEMDDAFEMELEENTLSTTIINKDCLKKKVCSYDCGCGRNIYFELKSNDPRIAKYDDECQRKKVVAVQNALKSTFSSLRRNTLQRPTNVRLRNYKNNMFRLEENLRRLAADVKKLCTEEQAGVSPLEQFKQLLRDNNVLHTETSYAQEFLQKAPRILAAACPCQELGQHSNEEKILADRLC